MKSSVFFGVVFCILLSSCTKEEPELGIQIIPSTFNVDSGNPIDFIIEGRSEFLVFYSGLDGQRFDEYPNAIARSVNMLAEKPTFSFIYDFHGKVNATFVASSYGNWGEDNLEKTFEFTFEVTDNNTDIEAATLKTAGLFGEEYEGVVNAVEHVITVNIPPGNIDLSKITTNLVAASTRSVISLDDAPFVNKSVVDFSAGTRTFKIAAIGGDTQDWEVRITRI